MTKPKAHKRRKVVPRLKAVAKAIVEPVAVPEEEPMSRWTRFQFWALALPSRLKQAFILEGDGDDHLR
jgi:hypothetical protein